MKAILSAILFVFMVLPIKSQSWTFSADEDVFDGKYRSAKVIGNSTDNTFKTPVLALNKFEKSENYNLYISSFGYFCDDPKLEIKFDNSPLVFFANLSKDNQQSAIFFRTIIIQDENGLKRNSNKFELLDNMMKKSTMYCRFTDECSSTRIVYSLSGSGKAIRFVYGNKVDEINETLKTYKLQEDYNKRLVHWRNNIDTGYALLKITGLRKFGKLYEHDNFSSKEVTRFTESDTVKILSRGEKMINIMTSDSIIGYINRGSLYMLE